MPTNKNKNKPKAIWNVNKPEGWSIYERIMDGITDKINSIVDNDKITIDEAIKRIDTLENKVKFKVFGKTTRTKKNFNKVSKAKYMDNIELLEVQAKNIEKEVNKIKGKEKGSIGRIFKMKAAISGNKRSRQEATAVRNPKNGELTVSANEIKKVILEYCVDNLKNNTPKDEVRVLVEERRKEQKKRIEDTGGEGLDIDYLHNIQ